VAAAVLAGVGTASFQSKLDVWASKLNIPAVTALVHGWPMLLIFAGLILLLIHPVAEPPAAQASGSREPRRGPPGANGVPDFNPGK
jgi:hypothetical protein